MVNISTRVNTMRQEAIQSTDARFPGELRRCLGADTPRMVQAIGNLDILRGTKLAVFCSVKCPGSLILKTYDLMRELRDAGRTVIGGFHSPIEAECLSILLRGKQPLIICPARSLEGMRVRAGYKPHIESGRLLFLSGLPAKERRKTAETALFRNRFVVALADRIIITYAAPGGKIEGLLRSAVSWRKSFCTFDGPENRNIVALGGVPLRPEDAAAVLDRTKERTIL